MTIPALKLSWWSIGTYLLNYKNIPKKHRVCVARILNVGALISIQGSVAHHLTRSLIPVIGRQPYSFKQAHNDPLHLAISNRLQYKHLINGYFL